MCRSKSSKLFCLLIAMLATSENTFASSELANLVSTMQAGSWLKANVNSFSSVWTPYNDRVLPGSSYGSNFRSIINAWSGFAWDSTRGDLIIYGGGHANYAGNEVYTWHSDNLQWERASLPTQVTMYQNGSTYSFVTVDNGASPQSSHTYDNNIYLPTLDRFLTFGGYVFSNPGFPYNKYDSNGNLTLTGPYLFDPSKADGNKVGGATGTGVNSATVGGNMWQNRDIYSNLPNVDLPINFANGIADVTQINGKDVVYVVANKQGVNGNFLYQYVINDLNDPTLDSWSVIGTPHSSTYAYQGSGAYDPVNNIFVRTGSDASLPFLFWDLDNAGANNAEQSFVVTDDTGGAFAFTSLAGMGMEYDPVGKRFLLWGSGNAVYSLSHEGANLGEGWVLALDSVLPQAGPGGVLADNFTENGGVLGKWDYARDLGVFIGLKNADNGDIWVYKPSNFASLGNVPLPGSMIMFLSGISFLALARKHKADLAST